MLRCLILTLCVSPYVIKDISGDGPGGGCGCPGLGLVGQVGGALKSVVSTTHNVVAPPKKKKHSCKKAKGRETSQAEGLLPIVGKETFHDYVQRVFAIKDELTDRQLTRILQKYKTESNADYVRRIDCIFNEFPWLICRNNLDYFTLMAQYYYYKYNRVASDTSDEKYYARILRRMKGEDFNTYIKRMDCVYMAHPRLPIWRGIQFDKDSKNWYKFRKEEYSYSIRPSLNVKENLVETYKRRESEVDDDYSYFERICKRRCGERDKNYIERLSRIQTRFVDLPLWYSIEYIDMVKDYYGLIYRKKEKEECQHYYARLTHRFKGERLEVYVKRVALLNALFPGLPLWNNEDYLGLTKTYYREMYRKYEGEDDEKYLRRVTEQSRAENVDKYIKRMNIVRWVCKDTDLFNSQEYLQYTRPYYKDFYKRGSETVDLWFERIFKRSFEETDEEYVKRVVMIRLVQGKEAYAVTEKSLKYVAEFLRLLYKRKKGETLEAWLKRVKCKDALEDEDAYKTRLEFLATVYTDCKSLVENINGTGKQITMGKSTTKQNCDSKKDSDKKGEDSSDEDSSEEDSRKDNSSEEDSSEEDSSEENTNKEDKSKKKSKTNKSKSSIRKKKQECKQNTKNNDESTKSKKENKPTKSCTEEKIKKTFEKKDQEDTETYFKRITTKTATAEEYIKTLTTVRKYYPKLELWYDKIYIELIGEYYTAVYTKRTTESEEKYYERIVTKESYESEEQCAKRVEVVRELFPNLSLWSEERFYVKYTKKVYSVVYKKYKCEDDTTYYKRIVLRSEKESESVYVGRVTLIQRTFSSLSLWSCEKTLTIVKQFYSLKYTKRSGECDEDYVKRLTVKECWETSDEVYVQRVHLVHLVTVCSTVWYEDQYYKYTKVYYSLYYKKGDKEACVAWLTRVITLLPGESEENAIKRITLINKSKTGCHCWTVQNISIIQSTEVFFSHYLAKIKSTFCKSDQDGSSFEKKSKSSSSSSRSQSCSETEEQVTIKI